MPSSAWPATVAASELGPAAYLRARVYSPALGRFLTPDSLIPDVTNGQSLNAYAYVYNGTSKIRLFAGRVIFEALARGEQGLSHTIQGGATRLLPEEAADTGLCCQTVKAYLTLSGLMANRVGVLLFCYA